jgi:hypothetical protein
VEEETLVCSDVELSVVLWAVVVGVLVIETDVADVREVVVDALVCAGDDVLDEIEELFSPPFDVTELRASADESLTIRSLSTSCAQMSVTAASKVNNIRASCVRASMMLKIYDRCHK